MFYEYFPRGFSALSGSSFPLKLIYPSIKPLFCRFYAVAHVRTDKDVQNLIKSLNNLKINNHSLIVEPYDTLVQNGKEISVIQSDN